ncbi:MAG TPA: hypothetical protein VFF31_26435 [Blastocatellia bacterium]|nr:hypothetical protein [Blastocatellia bacterium]
MSNLSNGFAFNCNLGASAKILRCAGNGKARDHVSSMLEGIRAAHLAGRRKRVAYLSNLYLNSYHARLAATEMARRAMKPNRSLPKTLVPSIASSLDPWQGSTEEVRVSLIPKGHDRDERRVTMDFGVKNRAL